MSASTPNPKTIPFAPLINLNTVDWLKHYYFSTECKQRTLQKVGIYEANQTDIQQVVASVCQECLYSSQEITKRHQQQELLTVFENNYEHKAMPVNLLQVEVEQLRQENQRLSQCLKQVEVLLEIQKTISQLLSVMLEMKRSHTQQVMDGDS